ncbi:PLP-dependent aminotransferase family protein [Phytoactinopolyspora limicola]|uniref:MocR-like pyridoxine biosynthesis transcription factor PdxR n=1 Tax=Phytoactinopolyspora limicola TaxID=2715536 RepID=UPI0014076ED2|nr:PLP-dependent aminotransferase family protein [Phytoactinopolyspora limicola]
MPVSWATFGGDLHVEITGARPRQDLEDQVRQAIRDGRLRPGARLPSSRQLARDLQLARNTVAHAYDQLVAEGWLAARSGAGTWVAEHHASSPERPKRLDEPRPPRLDLRPGHPDVSAFPRSAWLAAARRALASASHTSLGYGDPRGHPELRTALAEYLGRVRGVLAAPDHIVICPGVTQGLQLVCEVLRERGASRLVMEGYGHPLHRGLVERSGLAVSTTDVDEQGAIVDDVPPGDALLLTAAHQFPLGVALSPVRRRAAVHLATTAGTILIEDDYDGEFRYDRTAVGALQALAPDHVIYAGTASKSLAPGLRLGWLVLPAPMVDDVVAAKQASGRLPSSIEQLTLAELITSGGYDRHIRRLRLAYRRRRDRLVATMEQMASPPRVTGIAAGLHALVELPPGVDEAETVARAARHGLAIDGLTTYTAPGHTRAPALVVGYSTPPESMFGTALATLRSVVQPRGAG